MFDNKEEAGLAAVDEDFVGSSKHLYESWDDYGDEWFESCTKPRSKRGHEIKGYSGKPSSFGYHTVGEGFVVCLDSSDELRIKLGSSSSSQSGKFLNGS